YTSPHLCRFDERIQIDGRPVPEDALASALEEVLDGCPELTFFETATVAAFHLFARFGVELAVVEVGLGGRLDATNVLEAQRENAKIAVALGREAGLSERAIAEGLRRVDWRGRLETIVTPGGEFLLDAAHNLEGAEALAAALRARGVAPSRLALVFGSMADK